MAPTRAYARPAKLGSGGLFGCLLASGLAIAAAGWLLGALGATSAAVAAAVVLGYFVSGQLVERIALQLADATGMLITMVSYAFRVVVIGGLAWWSMSTPAVAALFDRAWLAVGALAAVIGWVTGLLVGHSRARIPVYDREYQPPQGRGE